MFISENLKQKVIIVAESDRYLVSEISGFLRKQGFKTIEVAEDGNKIHEILRLHYTEPEQVGLIIVNENLPNCQLNEMCQSLSSNNDDASPGIPFIVLRTDQNIETCVSNNTSDKYSTELNHCFSLPINYSEFLIVVGFQLSMNHERFLRHHQDERLINELAERKVIDAKLKYLVVHDELTGLSNRQNFERQLRLILNQSTIWHHSGALLFIDIDRFSLINELEGFDAGDRILVEIVVIIRKLVADNDLFARIGSDEFCLFLENRSAREAKQFAEKIKQAVADYRFFLGDVCYSCSLSIGISELDLITPIRHPGELISRARQACKMAKENGRNLIWEYNEKDSRVQERNRDIFWVPLIRKALSEKRFFLVFQPVVDIISGDICHYETLIRMDGLNDHAISPSEFIPVSERMGLIHSIDLWVVENAIDFLVGLSSHKPDFSLAINLSSMAFQNETLLPVIKEKIERSQIDAKRIIFEITETAAIDNFDQTREMIVKIRSLGCKFALDDFGAGFCSFNYLKNFPVDYVKIDGQFIRNLINDETDQVLVKSMVEISSKLGKKTIAEYVETPEMISKLREIGIDLGQGYIFGKPEKKLISGTFISIANLLERTINKETNHIV